MEEKLPEQRTGSAVSFPRQAGVKHLNSLCSSFSPLLWMGLPPPQRFYPVLENWNRLKFGCFFSLSWHTEFSLCCRILLLDFLAKVKLSMWFNPREPKQVCALLYETMLPGVLQPVHSPENHNMQVEQQKNRDGKLCWLLLGSLQLSGEEVRAPAVSSTSGLSSAAGCCLWGPR